MQETLGSKILGAATKVDTVFWQFSLIKDPFIILDILIVSIFIYYIILLVKETRAIRIVYGLGLLAIVYFIGAAFDLIAVNYIFRALATTLLIAIPVIFQPEIRSALERLGRARFTGDFSRLKAPEQEYVIHEILFAVERLAKSKTGSLIVLSRLTGLRDYIESGMLLNARLSAQLLMSIFQPHSPLHDGAVVLVGNQIAAASVVLPLSDSILDTELGTRHRAAIGLSSQTDALIIVTSETKGSISVALGGQLRRLDLKGLERLLKREFVPTVGKVG